MTLKTKSCFCFVVVAVVDDDDDDVVFVVVLSQKLSIKSLVKIGLVIDGMLFLFLLLLLFCFCCCCCCSYCCCYCCCWSHKPTFNNNNNNRKTASTQFDCDLIKICLIDMNLKEWDKWNTIVKDKMKKTTKRFWHITRIALPNHDW